MDNDLKADVYLKTLLRSSRGVSEENKTIKRVGNVANVRTGYLKHLLTAWCLGTEKTLFLPYI
jgi:hypothetical protein